MKHIALLLFVAFLGLSAKAQSTATEMQDENPPIFKFEKETIDFGIIEKNSDGSTVFKFTNIGKSPLIIEDIKTTCGCTVPEKPKEPIMPGATGEIKVMYDTNKTAPFNKTITVVSNAKNKEKALVIKGQVVNKETMEMLRKKNKNMMSSDNQ